MSLGESPTRDLAVDRLEGDRLNAAIAHEVFGWEVEKYGSHLSWEPPDDFEDSYVRWARNVDDALSAAAMVCADEKVTITLSPASDFEEATWMVQVKWFGTVLRALLHDSPAVVVGQGCIAAARFLEDDRQG